MSLRRGDVVLVWFPNSDLTSFKRRPALVVQADDLGTGIAQTIVAMITTNMARMGHPSRVYIDIATPRGKASGLRSNSIIMTDNLATVLEQALHSTIGRIVALEPVDAALRHTFSL